ncbi:Spo0E family sporulation regulatory protein-aspartic acid phosphatase [Caloramator sp. E03]|uniref:Spo0E family sporulation regulatory protein-aspartic acid phosphatase n=1 Tax=Caloramator sp. E03 TaxID=2576307 RepID=UPI0011109209|nr:Spo0E family sporulation regulatory protein-aspartic acid phosphatase [Caloramator sp. E03]QCX32976.1 Spo0E family sporulation regulatory protein-aspartic acid phosphatase [Caloramator sp. E03]
MNRELEVLKREINEIRSKLNKVSLVLLDKDEKDIRDIIELSKKMDILITKYTILDQKP